VLIHCAAGVSRSTSLLIAYMMHKYQCSLENCLRHIMKLRPCVMPNKGFIKQLKEFAEDLGVKNGALCF
jgi:protein-tyrosine phosphatase